MAQYDDARSRMLALMEDNRKPVKTSNSIWYSTTGADNKVYGIVKEGVNFYIKTTVPGKEKIVESYEYIGGNFNNRRDHEYRSYNEATKHLENELMFINEAYGRHEDVSTVDFKRNEKALTNLTEAARKDIDRVNEIMFNADRIGMYENIDEKNRKDEESKGHASATETTKNNDPFTDKVDANMSFDGKDATVKGATPDNKEVSKGVEADLQSDAKKTKNSGSQNDYKDAHDDLDGEGVADQKKAGAKAVKMNEGCFEDGFFHNPDVADDEQLADPADEINVDLSDEAEPAEGESSEIIDNVNDDSDTALVGDDSADDGVDAAAGATEDVEGDPAANYDGDIDALFEEMEANLANAKKDAITGPEKTMDGPHGSLETQTWDHMDEAQDGNVNDPAKDGGEEGLKSFGKKGTSKPLCWDHMTDKDIDNLAEAVCDKLIGKKAKKETLQEAIDRIVKEEATKLNIWGKHPRYGKEPMTLPANKEVMAGTADRDFNDDSTKDNTQYGKKIGDGKPFDKVVSMLTDQVMNQINEMLKRK